VVSDMRMPEMDGAVLLNHVRERFPGVVRLILSGQSDHDMLIKSVGPTHQFLSKPCDADTLKATVVRAGALRTLLADEQLKAVVSGIRTLPSVPGLYTQLLDVLREPDSSLQEVARIISSDVAMTAKVLQLVNSAFFGLRRHIDGLSQAITYLGLDTIRAIVLTAGAFAGFEEAQQGKEVAETLYLHSMLVGDLAVRITKTVTGDKGMISNALMAGMLHDVGKLVFAAELPDTWRAAVRVSREQRLLPVEAERRTCGVTHAELGAYLLGLWGLPDPIVEAVAFHHAASRCPSRTFSALTAVHAANALVLGMGQATEADVTGQTDTGYLESVGEAARVPEWQAIAAQVLTEDRERVNA
jgi:HD-like signal output (HDOD) protein